MRVLIAGLGFLGEPLGCHLSSQGHEVVGLTHSAESADRLQSMHDFSVLASDLSDLSVLRASISNEAPFDCIVHCASSGRGGAERYRAVYFDGVKHLLEVCPEAKLHYTSSTSVYGQKDGSVVDEASPAKPDRETGQILRATEDLVMASGGVVSRLAGIYGPGRFYMLLKFLQKSATIEGDGGRYLNQAHQSDIVQALTLMLVNDALRSEIFNVVDSSPQTQQQAYSWLAEHFEGDLPPFVPPDLNRKRGWTHKRVSNAKLLGLGWQPQYPSFQDAVRHDPELVPSIRALVNS
jgi:nucleoside-diphosphate-sugar epimerase